MVLGLSLFHVLPRSRPRLVGAPAGRRHGLPRRASYSRSDSAHQARADGNGRGAAALLFSGRLDDWLGERAVQSAMGVALPSTLGGDGPGWAGGELAVGVVRRSADARRLRMERLSRASRRQFS